MLGADPRSKKASIQKLGFIRMMGVRLDNASSAAWHKKIGPQEVVQKFGATVHPNWRFLTRESVAIGQTPPLTCILRPYN